MVFLFRLGRALSFRTRVLLAIGAVVAIAGAASAALVALSARASAILASTERSFQRLELLATLSAATRDQALGEIGYWMHSPDTRGLEGERSRQTVLAVLRALGESYATELKERRPTGMPGDGAEIERLNSIWSAVQGFSNRLSNLRSAGDSDRLHAARTAREAYESFASSFGPVVVEAVAIEQHALEANRGAMASLRTTTRNVAAATGLATLLLALAVFFGVARRLNARLAEIRKAASAIGAGRLETRLPRSGHDELSLVAATFNRMAAKLRRRQRRVDADTARLQEIVAERTADLRAAITELAEIDAARRRFFTDVSHELRTPLTVVLGEAEITLRTAPKEVEPYRRALETILARAKRLKRRVDDLLTIARSETGSIELAPKPVAIGEVVSEAIEDIDRFAASRGVSLATAGEGTAVVVADKDWLRQALEGLLTNAVKFSPVGGAVAVTIAADADRVLIGICDEGPGIPDEERARIFERFYRGRSAAGRSSGYGVGLGLAKWLIDRHDGTITVESRGLVPSNGRGIGTRVVVSLPRAEEDRNDASDPRPVADAKVPA